MYVSPWTSERVDYLTSAWAKGDSASEISVALGSVFTRSAIIGKIFRLGLSEPQDLRVAKMARAIAKRPKRQTREKRAYFRPKPKLVFEVPEIRVVDLEPRDPLLTIIEIASDECHWPTHSEGDQHYFCGHPAARAFDDSGRVVVHSYCYHHRLRSISSSSGGERNALRIGAAA